MDTRLPIGSRRTSARTIAAAAAFALCAAAQAQGVARPDRFGNTMRFGLPLAAIALSLYESDTEGLKQFAESMALSQGGTELLKRAVDSKRPDGTGRGFPSGHVSAVFTAATYVHERYSLQWSIPFYALAAATAEERVRTHHHFTKDVVAGAVIGSASSWLFTTRFNSGHSRASLGYAGHTVLMSYQAHW
jgi:hypothetical protein